jgi:hypothetical protein
VDILVEQERTEAAAALDAQARRFLPIVPYGKIAAVTLGATHSRVGVERALLSAAAGAHVRVEIVVPSGADQGAVFFRVWPRLDADVASP